MKSILLTPVIVVAATTFAVANTESSSESGAKNSTNVTNAECNVLWSKANPTGAAKIPEADAAEFITDIKAVNTDGDNTIEQDEFQAACSKSLIKSSALTSQARSSSAKLNETSDRTPGKDTSTPAEQQVTTDGETSDRTPAN